MNDRRLSWRLGVTATLVMAFAQVAHAADTYRYKDPYGNWHTMKVPAGMAKHYYEAHRRVAEMTGSTDCPVCGPGGPVDLSPAPPVTPRMAQLQAHPGLVGLQQAIGQAATASGVEVALISAVIAVESGFRTDARSPKGAVGLMQLMPQTAVSLISTKDLDTALIDPSINIGAGTRHLRGLIDKYPGRLELALAAYNAGQGAVAKYDGIPPYKETRDYVRDVMSLYQWYHAAATADRPKFLNAKR